MFKTVVILIQSVCAWIMSETSLSLQTAGLFPGRRSLIGLGNRSSEACQRDHDRDLSCQLKKKNKKENPSGEITCQGFICKMQPVGNNEEELSENDVETTSHAQEKAHISFLFRFSLIHHSHACEILHQFADNGAIFYC